MSPTLRLNVQARPENIAVVRQALTGVAEELGADPDLIDDIKTAASEAATNVVVHAYPESEGPMEVVATARDRRFEILIRDRGIGMQPRALSAEEPSLRVGLALIGALASGFEIRGEEDEGTEVRIIFELDGAHRDAWGRDAGLRPSDTDETVIAVRNAEPGGAAIPKVLELLAARSNLDLDRLADIQLIGDYLSHWSASAAADSRPLEISIKELANSIQVRIGPLEAGAGAKMVERGSLPGIGDTLSRLADSVEVTSEQAAAGPADFVTLQIRDSA